MADIERKNNNQKQSRNRYEKQETNQTKEILHRAAACPLSQFQCLVEVSDFVVRMAPLSGCR